eukprot:GFUD01028643.1.p1 GENE.GFUD01028643.1~~GFUD01028643.1.p1  ORF type:complete len:251 (-),score=95.05 GFUD01028643.1:113-865(-)
MDDFTKIGLLDFQSRGGQNTSLHSHNQNKGMFHNTDFSTFPTGQTTKFNQREKAQQVATSSPWNLEELMSDLALVYVSGDREGQDGDKLQFCTSKCCNSRVKYARVCREKETTSWERETTSSTWDIPRQTPSRDMLSSWDLGSDGASTPGSGYNCWAPNTQDSLGVGGLVGGLGHQWAGVEYTSTQHSLGGTQQTFLENITFDNPEDVDTWACSDLLGPEAGLVGQGGGGGQEDSWNRIRRKSKKNKTIK